MKNASKIFILLSAFFGIIIMNNSALAVCSGPAGCASNLSFESCPLPCEWTDSTSNPSSGQPVKLDNPLGDNNLSVNQLIGRIINSVLGLVGSLALLMFVYGGLTWMMAAGASEKVQKGKDIIIWAIIGLIAIFMAYALINFVLGTVIGGVAA